MAPYSYSSVKRCCLLNEFLNAQSSINMFLFEGADACFLRNYEAVQFNAVFSEWAFKYMTWRKKYGNICLCNRNELSVLTMKWCIPNKIVYFLMSFHETGQSEYDGNSSAGDLTGFLQLKSPGTVTDLIHFLSKVSLTLDAELHPLPYFPSKSAFE